MRHKKNNFTPIPIYKYPKAMDYPCLYRKKIDFLSIGEKKYHANTLHTVWSGEADRS
jgi:hypothetical protein